MSRSNKKDTRVYIDGYDLSGYTRDCGTLAVARDTTDVTAYGQSIKHVTLGHPSISCGPINTVCNNDAASAFNLHYAGTGTDYVTVAIGVNGAPAAGDPLFAWYMDQKAFNLADGASTAMTFEYEPTQGFVTYGKPWGTVILPLTAKSAANGDDNGVDNGASTSAGGIFVYHATGGDDTTITLTLEDSDDNGTDPWAAVTGATSGVINPTVTPVAGMVQLATTTTIKRYVRWQLDITGGSSAVSLFYGLIRG